MPLAERLADQTDKSGECWLWTGLIQKNGYGVIPNKGRGLRVHRVAWELANGPIPKGKEIHHLCGIRHCLRPSHLQCITHYENLMASPTIAALNAAKTHCPKGHEYTPENIRWNKSDGSRMCRACHG